MTLIIVLVSIEQKQLYADNLEHSKLVHISPFLFVLIVCFKTFCTCVRYINIMRYHLSQNIFTQNISQYHMVFDLQRPIMK